MNATNETFYGSGKVHGRGRVQIPKDVRDVLKIEDGDQVLFNLNNKGEILLRKAPKLKKELKVGKYGG